MSPLPKPGQRGRRWGVLLAAVPLLLLGTATPGHAGPAASPDCRLAPQLRPAWFPVRPHVDNEFFPLRPGTRWTLRGTVGKSQHRVVTTVTDLTKTGGGVTAVVVRDEDFDGNRLQEDELALFAQDRSGTVWALAEYPEVYEKGKLTGAPDTWATGIHRARAGIAVLASPHKGTPAYSQGTSASIQFQDCARVVGTGERVTVPAGTFHGVLQTDEWSPPDPASGHQEKFYAPCVGLIRATPKGGDSPETLDLDQVTQLSATALTAVHRSVLAMDARGRHVSPDVWGHLPAAR